MYTLVQLEQAIRQSWSPDTVDPDDGWSADNPARGHCDVTALVVQDLVGGELMDAPLSPVCAPALQSRLVTPADLANAELLRSYRMDEWKLWFKAAGLGAPNLRGWMFDSSLTLVEAAAREVGVALVPVAMFSHDIATGRIVQPFDIAVRTGSYWLTRLKSREETPAMTAFREWLVDTTDTGKA